MYLYSIHDIKRYHKLILHNNSIKDCLLI